MPRKYTEAQKKSATKWDAENLDRFTMSMPKGDKARYTAHATAMGDGSLNRFIRRAVEEQIKRDTSE